jgi:CobQ-like glutamine amidotransferase family enzyme
MTMLRVVHLYPEHLNIYADRGNMMVLEQRCAARGIGFAMKG